MAKHFPEHVQACLDRRRSMLRQPREALMAWAAKARADTEAELRGWVEFDAGAVSQAGTGPLAGIPVGIKDVIDVAGMPTRAGSRSREAAAAAKHDAEVVARLRTQGAVICGKTATTEFAYLDPSPATNPFNSVYTPGGSSSGSAAVVGAGVVPLALGTQTAGSVCRPAAWCGTYAFKPSTGRTPGSGVEPFAPSFDTVGVFGLDLSLVVQAALSIMDDCGAVKSDSRRLSIAWLDDSYFTDISPECKEQLDRALALLRAAGCSVRGVGIGLDFERLRDVHRSVMQFEAYVHHRRLLDTEPEHIGPHWKAALQAGALLEEKQASSARQVLVEARGRIEDAVGDADLVIGSPVRTEAPAGIGSTGDAGLIIPWTYAGAPLTVLPTGLSAQGMPLGLMLAGRRGQDRKAMGDALSISAVLRDGGMSIDT